MSGYEVVRVETRRSAAGTLTGQTRARVSTHDTWGRAEIARNATAAVDPDGVYAVRGIA